MRVAHPDSRRGRLEREPAWKREAQPPGVEREHLRVRQERGVRQAMGIEAS